MFVISHRSIILVQICVTDVYIKTEIGSFIANVNIRNYYNKTELGDIDDELSTLILNTYNTYGISTCFTYYVNIGCVNTQFDLRANKLNTYTTSEAYNLITLLGIPYMLNMINNSGINITDMFDTRYTKPEVDNLTGNVD